jgi:monofunctional biosynthetic peptidoglycan transglycosylase
MSSPDAVAAVADAVDLPFRHPFPGADGGELAIVNQRARLWLRLAGAGAVVLIGVPLALVLPWRWIDPPTSAFMALAQAEGYDVEQRWVDLAEMSPHLAIAVVAAEDQNFPHHRGFDLESIRSAFAERDSRQRGASTISQQVVKNLFLWPRASWLRKGIEAYLTLFVETLWSKRRILEIYLNVAELGPGIFGAEAAAERFFGVPAAQVSTRQAALLAAVLPSPKRLSAARPSAYVEERASWILRQMDQLGGAAYLESIGP